MEDGVGVVDYMEAMPKGSTLRELIGTATRLSIDEDLGVLK